MGRRWKWFMRSRNEIDLIGPTDNSGRGAAQGSAPEFTERSRCDGAVVYERAEAPRAIAETRSRPDRYERNPTRRPNKRAY